MNNPLQPESKDYILEAYKEHWEPRRKSWAESFFGKLRHLKVSLYTEEFRDIYMPWCSIRKNLRRRYIFILWVISRHNESKKPRQRWKWPGLSTEPMCKGGKRVFSAFFHLNIWQFTRNRYISFLKVTLFCFYSSRISFMNFHSYIFL